MTADATLTKPHVWKDLPVGHATNALSIADNTIEPMKNREDLVNFLIKVESEFPVTRWAANGVSLWPLLRMRSLYELYQRTDLDIEADKQKEPDAMGAEELARARFDLSDKQPAVDCLFLTNSINVKQVDDSQVDIFADPVKDALENSGFTCLTLELEGLSGYSPRQKAGRLFVSGSIDEYADNAEENPPAHQIWASPNGRESTSPCSKKVWKLLRACSNAGATSGDSKP